MRRAGGDLEAGDVVFEPGTVLDRRTHRRARERRRAARARVSRVRVSACCRPATSSSSRAPLAPGKIRDSNRPMLLAQLAEAGAEPVDLGTAHDDDDVMTAHARRRGRRSCDAVITSGGVSVGDFDYVSDALERIAADDPSRRVARRLVPGRDQAREAALLRACVQGTPVFGLPGNPVSSFVSFELFARPALRQMMGHDRPFRPRGPRHRRRRRCRADVDGKLHLDRVVVDVVDGALRRDRACARRRATRSPRPRPPTGSPCSPTATASTPATAVTVMLLD